MKGSFQKGITYIELVTVLSIFSIITAISIYDFRIFESNIQVKSLVSDIALKLVEAQRNAVFGKVSPPLQAPLNPDSWRPAYGLAFDLNDTSYTGPSIFYSYVDLDQDKIFTHGPSYTCPLDDCLERIDITKGNKISNLKIYDSDGNYVASTSQVDITYTRPSTTATFYSSGSLLSNIGYIEIELVSPNNQTVSVKVFSSGRIELN
jgi:type II secretory pathway pseudopilin PulG